MFGQCVLPKCQVFLTSFFINLFGYHTSSFSAFNPTAFRTYKKSVFMKHIEENDINDCMSGKDYVFFVSE